MPYAILTSLIALIGAAVGSDSNSDLLNIFKIFITSQKYAQLGPIFGLGLFRYRTRAHITRHHDIDGFTMDLLENRDALTAEYRARG